MIFWGLAGLMTAGLVLALLIALGRTRVAEPSHADQAVYRDQLDEIARDEARGVIGREEAEAARVEISRRLLAADRAAGQAADGAPARGAGPRRHRRMAVALVIVVPAAALALYLPFGNPALDPAPGAGSTARPLSEEEIDRVAAMSPEERAAFFSAMANRFEARLAGAAPDAEALARLSGLRALAGQPDAAIATMEAALRLDPENLSHLDGLARLKIERDGEAAPRPDTVLLLERIRALDPQHLSANWYLGLDAARGGRPGEAAARWRAVLSQLEPGTTERATLEREIERLEAEAQGPTEAEDAAPGDAPGN